MARVALMGLIGCFGFETLTVSSASKALTATVYNVKSTTNAPNKIARFALITVETDAIRFTMDGATAPTTTVGHKLAIGDVLLLESANDIANFRAIRITTDATIQVSYS